MDGREKTVGNILKSLQKYGSEKVTRFQNWMQLFEYSF
jgi:gamma-glutamylcysteine synthetase